MQTFPSFHSVYKFFLRVQLDDKYVKDIDIALERGNASKEVRLLIQSVKAFHSLRSSLCKAIVGRVQDSPLLDVLHRGHGIEQVMCVPEGSTCAISQERLTKKQGILLLVNGVDPYTVHMRYKAPLYYFWVLVHFPEEIGMEGKKWLLSQNWQTRRQYDTVEKRVEWVSKYQDKMFSKKMYLKLKGIAQYIQREFPPPPINEGGNNIG